MYVDVAGTSQQNIADEIEDLARKKLGPGANITFQVHRTLSCTYDILSPSVIYVFCLSS